MIFFFFVKQKTAYELRISDWSSDVCSSDLRRDIDIDVYGPVFAFPEYRIAMFGMAFHPRTDATPESVVFGRRIAALGPRHQRGHIGKAPVGRILRRHDMVEMRAFIIVKEGAFGLPRPQMPRQLQHIIGRSEEHTSELQSLMRISYAVFCLTKKKYS